MNAAYNDVVQWKYSEVPNVFTDRRSKKLVKTYRISTRNELEALFQDREFADGEGLRVSITKDHVEIKNCKANRKQFVEMHMPKGDAPKTLKDFGANASERAS